jgi:type II secretory pathway pseudopilin PulG
MNTPSRYLVGGVRKHGIAGDRSAFLGGTSSSERVKVTNGAAGFTLVEIVIGVFILLLLLGLAVPSLNGVLADRRLHHSLDHFNDLVRQAHERSLAERRPYLIVLDDRGARLQPVAFLKNEAHQPVDAVPAARGEKWQMELPAALAKTAPAEWIFWESGVCEPARISFAGRDGKWSAQYSPLSAVAEIVSYVPR